MKPFRTFKKPIALVSATAFFAAAAPIPAVQASLVGTDQVIEQAEAAEARDRVNAFLTRDDVREQMAALGVSPDEAKARVASLSDSELAKVAGQLDSMPAGQGLGTIIGAAVLIFVILLVTDLLGLTNAFGFTKKGSLNP